MEKEVKEIKEKVDAVARDVREIRNLLRARGTRAESALGGNFFSSLLIKIENCRMFSYYFL